MKYFKNFTNITLVFFPVFLFFGLGASGFTKRLAGKIKPSLKIAAEDLRTNWRAHAKSAGGWGLGSFAYYTGADYVKDLNPTIESKHVVSSSNLKNAGIPENTTVNYFEKSSLFPDTPDKRWMRNGKGFWENLVSVASPSTPYFNKKGELMVPTDVAERIAKGDVNAINTFNTQVKDQFERSENRADSKENIACAANIAALRVGFGLPYVKAAKVVAEATELGVGSLVNRGVIRNGKLFSKK